MKILRNSILLRLCLLMTLILAVVFLVTGRLLRHSISVRSTETVEAEIAASFEAYEALWHIHSEQLNQISSVISSMADVRAAFSTNDEATIQDTAGELWQRVSPGNALFAVAAGDGRVLASVGKRPFIRIDAQPRFLQGSYLKPQQKAGFLQEGGRLFQVSVTPVYVDAQQDKALLDFLVVGFELDRDFLHSLKQASGGSDFIFQFNRQTVASTLDDGTGLSSLGLSCAHIAPETPRRIESKGTGFLVLNRRLTTLMQGQQANLCLVRSLASSESALQELLRQISNVWIAGFLVAILFIYLAVRRMLQPIADLDRAASQIEGGAYGSSVPETRDDELGRLARSFNSMSSSLEEARRELIRNERLTAVSRLATFVVHDLRNPLASIYAGAEMLVDDDLPSPQVKRLARNMYQASRGVMAILNELISVARNTGTEPEICSIRELVVDAWNGLTERSKDRVRFTIEVPAALELPLNRHAIERVLHNLLENSVEAIGEEKEGSIAVRSEQSDFSVLVHFLDNGRGIHADLRPNLFQPFATHGREGGLGLGLALSKETARAHGGDLWADFTVSEGSHFILKLPNARS